MTELTLSDMGIRGVLSILGSLLSLILAVYFTAESRQQWRHGPPLTGRDVLGTFAAYFFAVFIGWQGYGGVRGRHLLRVSGRYTAATVTRVRRVKAQWMSHYIYAVNGERFTTYVGLGSRPALPVGSRWYVRFAAADPAVHTWTNAPLADVGQTVPPAGWSYLPAAAAEEAAGYEDPSTMRTATQLDEGEDVAQQ